MGETHVQPIADNPSTVSRRQHQIELEKKTFVVLVQVFLFGAASLTWEAFRGGTWPANREQPAWRTSHEGRGRSLAWPAGQGSSGGFCGAERAASSRSEQPFWTAKIRGAGNGGSEGVGNYSAGLTIRRRYGAPFCPSQRLRRFFVDHRRTCLRRRRRGRRP